MQSSSAGLETELAQYVCSKEGGREAQDVAADNSVVGVVGVEQGEW